jgi:cytochrome c oxidase subunit 2
MTNFLSIFNHISNDVAQPWQLGFQDSAAPGFTGIVTLHNTVAFYLVLISFSVF